MRAAEGWDALTRTVAGVLGGPPTPTCAAAVAHEDPSGTHAPRRSMTMAALDPASPHPAPPRTAAAEIGMPQALAALGSPAVLAHGYLAELGRPRPRFTTGAIAAALAVGAIWYLQTAYAIGVLDTLEAVGGGTVTLTTLGAAMTYTSTASTISVEGTLTWQWLVLWLGAGLLVFVPDSRLWRLWR